MNDLKWSEYDFTKIPYDDLVRVLVSGIDHRTRPHRMLLAIDQHRARALEEEQQFLFRAVLVLANIGARRDHLDARRQIPDRRIVAFRHQHLGIAVRRHRLPITG